MGELNWSTFKSFKESYVTPDHIQYQIYSYVILYIMKLYKYCALDFNKNISSDHSDDGEEHCNSLLHGI